MNTVLFATALGLLSFLVDTPIVDLFSRLRTPFLTSFFSLFTGEVLIGAVLLASFFLWRKQKRTMPVLISCSVSVAVIHFLKLVIARSRPLGEHLVAVSTAGSFPSGHAGFVFAALPFLDSPLWFVFSLATAFSRVYLGVHYLSDVIFGGIIGYLIGLSFKKRLQ